MSEEKPFKQVSPTEYEVQLEGRTRTIKVPFSVTESIFASFISAGGIIDAETGLVQTDLLTLIRSFRTLGNLLLTEFDYDTGKVLKEGNCSTLATEDVVVLFQLATHVVEVFIQTLAQIQTPKSQPESPNVSEKEKTTKD